MLELTVAAFCHHQHPPISLQQPDHFANLHPDILSEAPGIRASDH